MVSHDLLVEHLDFLDVLSESVNFLLVFNVFLALMFLKGTLFVSETQESGFKGTFLMADLLVELICLVEDLACSFIW